MARPLSLIRRLAMIRRVSVVVLSLAVMGSMAFDLIGVTPVAAQSSSDLRLRLNRSANADDPDDVPEVTVTNQGNGFRVNTGPAVVAWNNENTASGTYTLKGRFTLIQPSGHTNYYGLVYGGSDLEGSGQNYLYFLVAQDGSYLVKHRADDDTTHDIQGRTPHSAVVTPNEAGTSVNDLEVRVGADATEFVVNGVVVFTAPKTGMAGRTDGIWGVRINHTLPGVLVEDLGVTE
jgi:hypothetical protein